MRLPKIWLMALLVLPAAQGRSQERQAEPLAQQPPPPIVTLPAPVPVRPNGQVLDQADILQAANEAALGKHLNSYRKRTGNALVVVSVSSLQGEAIEPYATRLFNSWGIGDRKTGQGLLILVAPRERKVRIEVGCGLEAAITDAVAAQIIQQVIVPVFSNGDLQGGTLAGVKAIEKQLATTKARGPTSDACKKIMRQSA